MQYRSIMYNWYIKIIKINVDDLSVLGALGETMLKTSVSASLLTIWIQVQPNRVIILLMNSIFGGKVHLDLERRQSAIMIIL